MNLLRCLAVAVPAAALATFGPSTSATPAASLASALDAPLAAVEQDAMTELTGQIRAWYVFADGTVAIRLDGQNKERSYATWFVTPADKTETTRFEHLMMGSALALARSGDEITIAYEKSNEKTGKTVKEAVPIHAVMWGTSFNDANGQPAPKK